MRSSPVALGKKTLERTCSARHGHQRLTWCTLAHQNATPFQLCEPLSDGLRRFLDRPNLCYWLAATSNRDRSAGAYQTQYLGEARLGFVCGEGSHLVIVTSQTIYGNQPSGGN